MFDKIIYDSLHFIMKYAGQLNSWAWRKHTKMLKHKQKIENEEYEKRTYKKKIDHSTDISFENEVKKGDEEK